MVAKEVMYFLFVQCFVISLLTSTAQGKTKIESITLLMYCKALSVYRSFCFSSNKGLRCEVDGKFYTENEYFASGVGDCALCSCIDRGLSCDITNCQEIESNRFQRNVMENTDLDNIENQLIEKMSGEGEYSPELNIILNKLVHKQIIKQSDKSKAKRIYLDANGGVDNYTPYVLNITTSPGQFNLTRVNKIMINKTYGISFKPATKVLGYTIQTDLDSTGIDPIVLYEYELDMIETASHQKYRHTLDYKSKTIFTNTKMKSTIHWISKLMMNQ